MYASCLNTDSSFLCLFKDAYLSVMINLFIINYEVTEIIKRPVEKYLPRMHTCCQVGKSTVLAFGKLAFFVPPPPFSYYLTMH